VPSYAVLLLCSSLATWSAWALPLLRVAPNRLLSGEPVYLGELLSTASWLLVLLAGLLVGLLGRFISQPGNTRRQPVVLILLISLLCTGLLALAGRHASNVAADGSGLVRTSLASGFWSLLVLAWLIVLDALNRAQRHGGRRIAWLLLAAAPVLALIILGQVDHLSIMKEYDNRSDIFWQAVWRHILIVLLAITPTVLLGLPLAWSCQHFGWLRRMVFPVLNLIQTIPSIALFGLFMAPLAWLAASYPPLARAGISGVGLAPAVLALVLYSLLPVVRSGLAGLEQVPNATRSAARAMGMSGWQVFRMVELPLALPMVLPGLRTAVVQAIGLTAVTALIGAGGLGTLMFDGLFSAANELVLLGVLPIVLLAALADALFDTMGVWVRPVGVSEQGANG
jgi:osmoprotectant transport system permease protein